MGTFFPYHYITYGNRHALVRICENRSIMKSMAMVDFFIENKGTFFPYHYITYGNRHALVRICENGSIMKSMAMVDFFIENKGTFFPYHYITYGNRHALVRICENGSIMKSMAMVDFFIENKGTFFPYHYITYGNRHALVVFAKIDSIMKSMAINSTSSLKIKELSSHIITLPMEAETRFGPLSAKMGGLMKSMTMVDFFIENKGTFFPYHYITYGNRHALVRICENRSIMKSMAMVDFFIENKGTFFPYYYITYGNRHALVRICENGSIMKSMAMVDFFNENKDTLWSVFAKMGRNINPWLWSTSSLKIKITYGNRQLWSLSAKKGSIMKSMAMVDFFIENKGTFFPYHYITYGNGHALVRICENGLDNEIHPWLWWTSSLKIKGTFFPYHYITYGNRHALVRICENRSIMKSMAMVDFFIENKGTFFPYYYITYGNRHALVRICENGSIMKSMAMVDFFNENKGKGVNFLCKWELSSHIITLPMESRQLWSYLRKWVKYKSLAMVDFFIENKKITYGSRDALVRYLRKWVDNEIHGYNSTSSLKIKEHSSHIITLPMESRPLWSDCALVIIGENGSIMKSMAMVDFFIVNKDAALVIICENGSIMKSMAMSTSSLKIKELSSHILTLPMETDTLWNFLPISLHYQWKQTRFGHYQQKWVVNEIHDYGTFFPYHYITYENRHALVHYMRKWVDNEIHGYGRLLH
ncbi:hypothetical protein H6P81_021565 [Aristolochia fimbriata]|uniref:Uncharacterized protein n=1 Tax=Aristolochia fimbriata TaxID=158543 RepID=A0AAV7DRB1_ARIFI|nr:hypothetical protein H6P81_021565 [Aristolochia fimbriata]